MAAEEASFKTEMLSISFGFFFFIDTASSFMYKGDYILCLHDALPILSILPYRTPDSADDLLLRPGVLNEIRVEAGSAAFVSGRCKGRYC